MLIIVCLLLQACSATAEGLGHSLWDSVFDTPGIQMMDDEIQDMPYTSQHMRLDGGPQLFVILAFTGNGRQKRVTQDRTILVTQCGRIVRTYLDGDSLIEVNNLAADPLLKPNQIVDGIVWAHTMSWIKHQQARYATACLVFKWDGAGTIKVDSDDTPVQILDEEVTTDRTRWHNRY